MSRRVNSTMGNPQNIESRVGKLEGAVEALSHDVQEIHDIVRSSAQEQQNFQKQILNEMGKATAPRWPLIASIGSLVIALLTLVGGIISIIVSGQGEAITKANNQIEQLQSRIYDTRYEDGKNAAWKEEVSKNFNDLYDKIKNELRVTEDQVVELKKWRITHVEEDAYRWGKADGKTGIDNK